MPPKITIQAGYDQSHTKVSVTTLPDSSLELSIGEAFDMSIREIVILEKEAATIGTQLQAVKDLVAELARQGAPAALRAEVSGFAATAERIVTERKWYSVSLKGLMEAAAAVGTAASPAIDTCVKLLEMLKKARAG